MNFKKIADTSFNLIRAQPDNDNLFYAKDSYEAKYQFLIKNVKV